MMPTTAPFLIILAVAIAIIVPPLASPAGSQFAARTAPVVGMGFCGDGQVQNPNDQGVTEVCDTPVALDCPRAQCYVPGGSLVLPAEADCQCRCLDFTASSDCPAGQYCKRFSPPGFDIGVCVPS